MYELKKCPYCGGQQGFGATGYERDAWSCGIRFRIKCLLCGASAPGSSGGITLELMQNGELKISADDREKAVEASNKRADNG